VAAYLAVSLGTVALIASVAYKLITNTEFLGVHAGFLPIVLSFLVYFSVCFIRNEQHAKT
jgi:hypothetical protein